MTRMAALRLSIMLAAALLLTVALPTITRASDTVLDNLAALVTPATTPPRSIIEVSRQDAVFRVGPGEDYDRRFPLQKGVQLRVLDRRGTWLKVDLGGGDAGWVEQRDVRPLPAGSALPEATLRNVLIRPGQGQSFVDLQLSRRIAFDVVESADPQMLELRLHATTLMMHEIASYSGTEVIRNARVDQPAPGRALLQLRMGTKGLWGWRASYVDSPRLDTDPPGHDFSLVGPATLRLVVRHGPALTMQGLKVVIDPGHGGKDSGAVGVAGMRESQGNLAVSLALRDALTRRGATVFMTRTADVEVADEEARELPRRVDIAREMDGDVFISIHHNARPRVDDSRLARGTFVYYYRQQSADLAEALTDPLADAVGEKPRAYVWRSFHVIRQTWMPSVLVEAAFISNPDTEAEMQEPEYARRAAEGLAKGLERFIQSRASRIP